MSLPDNEITNVPADTTTPFEFDTATNENGQIRNDIMSRFLSQYNTFITRADVWDNADNMYVVRNGVAYYDKAHLLEKIAENERDLAEDAASQNEAYTVKMNFDKYFGADTSGSTNESELVDIINVSPPGMPTYKGTTDKFYEFDGSMIEGGIMIAPEMMNRTLLDMFKNTFTGSYGPFYAPVDGNLFIRDQAMYFTDLTNWRRRPDVVLGVYFSGKDTPYNYFFPFAPITDPNIERQLREFCAIDREGEKELKIINL